MNTFSVTVKGTQNTMRVSGNHIQIVLLIYFSKPLPYTRGYEECSTWHRNLEDKKTTKLGCDFSPSHTSMFKMKNFGAANKKDLTKINTNNILVQGIIRRYFIVHVLIFLMFRQYYEINWMDRSLCCHLCYQVMQRGMVSVKQGSKNNLLLITSRYRKAM